jgi:hypothetical protein
MSARALDCPPARLRLADQLDARAQQARDRQELQHAEAMLPWTHREVRAFVACDVAQDPRARPDLAQVGGRGLGLRRIELQQQPDRLIAAHRLSIVRSERGRSTCNGSTTPGEQHHRAHRQDDQLLARTALAPREPCADSRQRGRRVGRLLGAGRRRGSPSRASEGPREPESCARVTELVWGKEIRGG